MAVSLVLNGKRFELDVEPDVPLLWAIREGAGLTGTKYGCGMALCGACTVHLNGRAIRSCVTPVRSVADKPITTIEGVSGPCSSGGASMLGEARRRAMRLLPARADHVRHRTARTDSCPDR